MVDLIIEDLNLKDILIVILVCEGVLWWVETRDAARHPTMHRTAPTAKKCPAQNVNTCEVEKARNREATGKRSCSFPEYLALIRFNFFIGVGLPRQLV